jgi:hypothetical protein
VAKRRLSTRKKALLWAAVGTPGVLAFMANTPAREAASNLASWIELFGLPVPDFLNTAGIDERVTDLALTFYGLVVALLGSGILARAERPVARRS